MVFRVSFRPIFSPATCFTDNRPRVLCSATGLQDAEVDVTITAPYLSEMGASLQTLLHPAMN